MKIVRIIFLLTIALLVTSCKWYAQPVTDKLDLLLKTPEGNPEMPEDSQLPEKVKDIYFVADEVNTYYSMGENRVYRTVYLKDNKNITIKVNNPKKTSFSIAIDKEKSYLQSGSICTQGAAINDFLDNGNAMMTTIDFDKVEISYSNPIVIRQLQEQNHAYLCIIYYIQYTDEFGLVQRLPNTGTTPKEIKLIFTYDNLEEM